MIISRGAAEPGCLIELAVGGEPEKVPTIGDAERMGEALELGAWHGDWTPWNMTATTEGLLVWDWERFGTEVPVGFDPLHYRLQAAIVRDGKDPRSAVGDLLTMCGPLLYGFGVPGGSARTTTLLYLIDLAARYLTDRQAQAGARLGVLGSWLLPELVAAVAVLGEHDGGAA